jgi:hypothetical protein
VPSPLGCGGRPCCWVQVLGSTGQELRDEVEHDEQARLGVGKGEIDVDQVREEDYLVQYDGADIGQGHTAWSFEGNAVPAEESGVNFPMRPSSNYLRWGPRFPGLPRPRVWERYSRLRCRYHFSSRRCRDSRAGREGDLESVKTRYQAGV